MVRRRTPARKKRTRRPPVGLALGSAPAKRSGAWLMLILGALVLVNLYVFVWDKKTGERAIKQQGEAHTGRDLAMTLPSAPLPALAPSPAAPGSTASLPPPATPVTTIEGKVAKSD